MFFYHNIIWCNIDFWSQVGMSKIVISNLKNKKLKSIILQHDHCSELRPWARIGLELIFFIAANFWYEEKCKHICLMKR